MVRELLALLITGITDLVCLSFCKICKKEGAEPTLADR